MSDKFNEDLDEEFETLTMIDDETNEEMEFVIIDKATVNGGKYLLVIESELIDDDEAEAMILKEIAENETDFTFAVIEDDDEFDAVAEVFRNGCGDEYEVQY